MYRKADEFSRRQFVIDSAKKYLGVTLASGFGAGTAGAMTPPLRKGSAKAVIYLNMSGGMSHLDTFDPKPEAKAEYKGKLEAIKTKADGILLSEYFPNTAKIMDKVALVRSMKSNQGAHEQGQYLLHRSYRPRGTIVHPSMGAWVMRLSGRRNETIPGYVTIGRGDARGNNGFMSTRFSDVPIGNPNSGMRDSQRPSNVSNSDYHKRFMIANRLNMDFNDRFSQSQIKAHQDLYKEAVKLMTSEDLKAFDINLEPDEMNSLYGDSSFGQGCLLARRLVEHKVRFVEVGLNGWDTHYNNFEKVEERAHVLDRGFAALVADLDRRGMLEETLVCIGTEFGRTPKLVEDHQLGRDHYPKAFSCVLAGGGVKGGQVHGETDKRGVDVIKDEVPVPSFNATIGYAMGLDLSRTVSSPSGRPFWMADKADPITALF